jgi:hypothetical protein
VGMWILRGRGWMWESEGWVVGSAHPTYLGNEI